MDVNSAGRGARSITRAGKRALSFGLALLMVAGMLFGYFSFASRVSAAGLLPTDGVIVRESDPSTMDTYLQMLDLLTDTRYAGRLWTDKSVFAYGQLAKQMLGGNLSRIFSKNSLALSLGLDGISGNKTIPLNSDFLEVFSALGSSVRINENIPVDFMFLLDVSGSMGADPKNNESSNPPGNKDDFDKGDLPINKTIKALNHAIETLLAANPESRFGVTIYGSTAAVLVPLGHYTKDGNTPFLTAGWKDKYGGTQGLHFSITATVKPRDGEAKIYYGDNAGKSNNEAHGTSGTGNLALDGTGGLTEGTGTEQEPFHVGHITNPQAGLAAAMDQFITGNEETTFSSISGKTYSRIPALLHITDGQATDIAWVQQSAESGNADPWRRTVSQWNNVNWKYDLAYNSKKKDKEEYNASQLSGAGAAAPVIFQTLMTAAYYKTAVNAHYNRANVDSAGGGVDLQCYSVYASDNKSFATMADDQVKATISAILDPEKYFEDLTSADSTDSSVLTAEDNAGRFIDTAYELYKKLAKGETITETYGTNATSSKTTPDIEDFGLPGSKDLSDAAYGGLKLTWDNVNSNINYVQDGHFQSSNFENISGLITGIVQSLQGSLFNPVVGQNDLGVSDSVTFMDPVGKYMEVKDVTYLALFGTLYNIRKAAVYSYEFNEAILATGKPEFKDGEYLKEGWYKGDTDNIAGIQYRAPEDSGLPSDPWAEGWVYRVNAKNAADYVPSLESIRGSVDGEDVTLAKMRMTEYTFYRVDVKSGFDEWRQNPAFGKAEGNITESTPGAYRLSDLRIWVEDTGEYNDSVVDAGGLESDTGFDRALWINIPANMIPLRTVTLSQDRGGNWTYESNIPGESDAVTPGSAESASFPLRVFYEVGVEEDMLTSARRVNTAFLSAEYIANNRVRNEVWEKARGLGNKPEAGGRNESGIGTVELFSNWYNPENRYGDYITSNTEYSYGDPAATFSPSDENSYYLFENALPLYKAAYQFNGNTWLKVDTGGDNFSGPNFGGKILAQDLAGTFTSSDAITLPGDVTPNEGDIVLFADDRLGDVTLNERAEDPFPSTGWYFLAIEFFELSRSDNTAESVSYCAARKGSEFGSAYQASGIKNGDMLCWYDASGKNTEVYPYLSADETGDSSRGRAYIGLQPSEYMGDDGKPKALTDDQKAKNEAALESGTWVVAARPGGLRVGNLAQQVQGKTTLWDESGNKTDGGDTYTTYYEYKALRFPDRGDEFTVGYYAGNITRTANNYYMPTISTSSSTGDGSGRSDIVVNTYLGNNGRLTVADTSVMVTKTLRTDAPGFSLNTERDFNFQVYIQGVTGSFDAVVVKQVTHSGGASTWSRQLAYADITPDSKLFLLGTDGTLAMVDENGNRVVKTGTDPDTNKAVYANLDGTPFSGQVYYVFVGSNTETGALRVYANPDGPNATGHTSVPVIKEAQKPGQNESAVYSVEKVWLCTPEQYEAYQGDGNGSYMNGDGSPVGSDDESKWKRLQPEDGFPLLTLTHETASAFSSSDVTVTGDYATNSPYWTEKVTFGIDPGKLYDTSVDGLAIDTSAIAANTAQITLKHGYGLLFAGLPNGTPYRFTEQISADDTSAGYSFESVTHVTGAKSQNAYPNEQGGQGAFTSGDGYYSITDASAVYEHSAHYVNTADPDALVVSKVLRTGHEDYPLTELDKNTEFTYTVTFTPPKGFGALGDLPFWKGNTSGLDTAPAPTVYDSIQSLIDSGNLLKPDEEGKYTFKLRGGESIVIYGLPIGTVYTVTETADSNYPIQDGSDCTSTGTVAKSSAANGNEVANKADFTNVKPTPESGTLAVEKRVTDEDDPGTAEFTFRVTLTVPPDAKLNYHFNANLLSSQIFSAEYPHGEDEQLNWSPDTDNGDRPGESDYTAEFTLRAGEKIIIYGVPYGTAFIVAEIGRPGYNLQSVTDNTVPNEPEDHLAPEGDAISGEITREISAASFVFNNARAPFLPFTGHGGARKFLAAGVLLVALAGVIRLVAVRRKRARDEA